MPADLKKTRQLLELSTSAGLLQLMGIGLNGRHKRVIVESSSPNVAKPFHAGHLRSTLLGRFVCNILRSAGHDVISVNYLGDWGTQFGMVNEGLTMMDITNEHLLCDASVETFAKAYAKAHKEEMTTSARSFFSRLEMGGRRERFVWDKVCHVSMVHLNKVYSELGVHFDYIQRESQFASEAKEIVRQCFSDGKLIKTENGLLALQHPKGAIPLQKSDGCTLYLSRDLAAAVSRDSQFYPKQMYYVVDNSQSMHFQNLKTVLEACGYGTISTKLNHVKFGKVRNMSTRRGTGVLVEEILNKGKQRALDVLTNARTTKVDREHFGRVAETLALSALVVKDFKQRRCVDYDFCWREALQSNGATGYFLQAAHARLCSLLESCDEELTNNQRDVDLSVLIEPQAIDLLNHLDVDVLKNALRTAYEEIEPYPIVQYLFRLCKLSNRAHKHLRVRNVDKGQATARLFLFSTAQLALRNGLLLLGVEPLNKV